MRVFNREQKIILSQDLLEEVHNELKNYFKNYGDEISNFEQKLGNKILVN